MPEEPASFSSPPLQVSHFGAPILDNGRPNKKYIPPGPERHRCMISLFYLSLVIYRYETIASLPVHIIAC